VKMERDLLKSSRLASRRSRGEVPGHGKIATPICSADDVPAAGGVAQRILRLAPPQTVTALAAGAALEAEIRAAHRRTCVTCGPERLQGHLAEHGVQVGMHRIRRLCKKLGLHCKQKRKCKATTDSKHNLPVAPNLLGQRCATEAPDQVWTGDLTYIATDEGWLYLAGLKHLYSGEIVGYAMGERMTRHSVMQALFRAVSLRPPATRRDSTHQPRPPTLLA